MNWDSVRKVRGLQKVYSDPVDKVTQDTTVYLLGVTD